MKDLNTSQLEHCLEALRERIDDPRVEDRVKKILCDEYTKCITIICRERQNMCREIILLVDGIEG